MCETGVDCRPSMLSNRQGIAGKFKRRSLGGGKGLVVKALKSSGFRFSNTSIGILFHFSG